ncbi:activator of HSP90 ATPase [Tersicoccus solisilvae]|uniref:Activator of HSP90 ATPase n=1 Tax=Tersicoccus solisilvae TaxID=1882339 RepID=A0ABQ1NPK8_9MICC|nr:SRPBCC domain-containing protein [Tersicoccus solisilvae]GGC82046.1 activator of HSP90 ATPase [Tersicoccus solisilvae]
MSVTSIDKDLEHLTLTLIADFDSPVDRVWQLWADPRQLERWWGPPTYPATFEQHDLTEGGTVTYYMTGPDGATYHGYWRVGAVRAPSSLAFTDGFADENGRPNDDMPLSDTRMELVERGGGTRMTLTTRFEDRAQMDQLIAMGMDEGLREAVGQMDGLLVAA